MPPRGRFPRYETSLAPEAGRTVQQGDVAVVQGITRASTGEIVLHVVIIREDGRQLELAAHILHERLTRDTQDVGR